MHQRSALSKLASIGQKLPLQAVLIVPFVLQLVGTVGNDALITNGTKVERQVTPNSRNLLIRSSSQSLNQHSGDLSEITAFQQLSDRIDGQRYFVSVMPYADEAGLDWLIVVTLSKQDVIKQIQANTKRTVIFCGITGFLLILLGLLIVRWITYPLAKLRGAARDIAIAAFQNIAQRRQTEEVLANYNQQLEQEIAERTRELQKSEATKAAILAAIPDLLIRQNRQGYHLDIVEGDDIQTVGAVDELIGRPVTEVLPPLLAEKRLHYTRQALDTGQRQIYEYEIEIQGELRYEEARIVPCGPDEVLIIIRDITSRKQIEAALRRSEAQNQAILTAIPDLMFQINTDGIYTNYVRTDALSDLIAAAETPIGQAIRDYLPSEMAEHQMQALKQALETQKPVIYEQQVVVNNAVRFEEVRVVASGADEALFIVRDVTDRKRAEQELEAQQQFIRQVLDVIPSSVFVKDPDGRLIMVNQACGKIHGLPVQEILGKREDEFNPNLSKKTIDRWMERNRQVMATGQPFQEINYITLKGDGEAHYYQTIISPLIDVKGQAQGVVGNSVDITELKQLEEELRQINLELERLATLDGLTQVPNRRQFDAYLETEWLRSQREQRPLALIMFDVDYFKLFNDFYGHQKGDDCLIKVAQTAQCGIRRPADLLARYGGEEFAVILPNTDVHGAIAVAEQIQQHVHTLQFSHEKSPIGNQVTISLGIACLIPQRHQSPHTLVELADQALYQAKKQGRDRYWVSSLTP